MIEAGVSVYAGLSDYNMTDNAEYLELAKRLGVKRVFSSAHINEASLMPDDLKSLINKSIELGLALCLDISKPAFDTMPLPENIDTLRLDYGFSDEDIVRLSNEASFKIELNASTISKEKILKLIENGLNVDRVSLSFNFYPKEYTGHDFSYVKERTQMFKSLGLKVYSFINSHTGFRPPLYEGLPTIEDHRHLDLLNSINELKICGVDGIIFGDAYASIEEIETLMANTIDEYNVEVDCFEGFSDVINTLNESYRFRIDYTPYMLRLGGNKKINDLDKNNCIERKRKMLTIDNALFKRYAGEVDIVLKDMKQDDRVNVIGVLNITDNVLDNLYNKRIKFIFREGR